jgi:3-oxoacyl-[acyl-carrier protein] reductase
VQNSILIIGASGTIGSVIAQKLSDLDIPLLLHGKTDSKRLSLLAEKLKAPKFTADLSNSEEAEAFVSAVSEKQDGLSGIVFCAAQPFPHKLTLRTDWSVFQEQFDSQLKSLHTLLQAFKPVLENRPDGAHVIILSTEYVLGSPPIKIAPYLAAKAALTAYSQVIAQELLKVGIRVHILAPGMVKSALTADMPDEYLDMIAADMPEKKLTSPQDVARICSFLLTPDADPLYGTIVPVSRANRR